MYRLQLSIGVCIQSFDMHSLSSLEQRFEKTERGINKLI